LFYVAVTRAEREVHLLSASERRRYDRRLPCQLSRFVEEIPREMLEVEQHGILARSTRWFDESAPRRAWGVEAHHRERAAPTGVHYVPEDDGAPQVGDAVVHRTFGEGVVVAKDGSGADARLTIQFAAAGRKKIVARYVTPAGGEFRGD
jgi:DNA helicase-2/ATP-dependent DNA helicase PcrA